MLSVYPERVVATLSCDLARNNRRLANRLPRTAGQSSRTWWWRRRSGRRGEAVVQQDQHQENAWYVMFMNYDDGEYHHLSRTALLEILREEWGKQFNGFFVGRDVECVGRLGVFFQGMHAYIGYEEFDSTNWWSSFDLNACETPDCNEMVRLTPDDAEDFSFRRCSLIPKEAAWLILEEYVTSLKVAGLYLEDGNGKPIIGSVTQ